MAGGQFQGFEDQRRKEGEVHIQYPNQKKSNSTSQGEVEDVDYEEVK